MTHAPPARRTIRRRGNALIETAFVMIPLMTITFGGIEFGYLFFVKHSLQGAAREGARAAISPNATQIDVTRRVAEGLKAAGLQTSSTAISSKFTLTTTPANVASAGSGATVTVVVQCRWGDVALLPQGFVSQDKQLTGSTVMRKEGPVD